jgi:hypothetical protein
MFARATRGWDKAIHSGETEMWNSTIDRNRDEPGGFGFEDSDTQVLDGLRDAYRQQGYEQGYIRATRDAVAVLVLSVEEFSRFRALGPVERAVLRDFQRFTERHLDASTPAFTYVEEGLGI